MPSNETSQSSQLSNEEITFGFYLDKIEEETRQDEPFTDNDRHKLRQLARIPENIKSIPIRQLTPEGINEFVQPWRNGDYGVNGLIEIMAIVRKATKMAYNDGVIPVNVGKMVKVKINQISISNITEEIYDNIQAAILSVPGGRIFGLSAHINAPMITTASITIENCYEENNIVHFVYNGNEKIVTICDPDGIEIFQTAIREYHDRMSNPDIAAANEQHLLFCTKYGEPYQEEHCDAILELIKECSETYDLNIQSIRRYLLIRSL